MAQPLDVHPVELPSVTHPGLDQSRRVNHRLTTVHGSLHGGAIGHVTGHRVRRVGSAFPSRLVAAESDDLVTGRGELGGDPAAEEAGDSRDQDPHASSPAT